MKTSVITLSIFLGILYIGIGRINKAAASCDPRVIACVDHNGDNKGQLFNDTAITFCEKDILSCVPRDYSVDQLTTMCKEQFAGCKTCTPAWPQQ